LLGRPSIGIEGEGGVLWWLLLEVEVGEEGKKEKRRTRRPP
jgi:hypothetical protein